MDTCTHRVCVCREGWRVQRESRRQLTVPPRASTAARRYFKRAWCRTELFFHWRLHCHTRKWRLTANSGQLAEEPRTRPRGDPATGDLFHEADRVALTNMTALFSYDDAD